MITIAPVKRIRVIRKPGHKSEGRLEAAGQIFHCVLGRGSLTRTKREGDGGTPCGIFRLRRLWFRSDRRLRPITTLPMRAIGRRDGWCDATNHPRYNRPVALPFPASHEEMWRADGLYDLVIEIGWNDYPAIRGRGSAIFMHVARQDRTPTAGCVALTQPDLRRLLPLLGPRTRIVIG